MLYSKQVATTQSTETSSSFIPTTRALKLTHLGEGLLVVILKLQWVDVELMLVGGERVVVLGLLRKKLLDLHRHPLTAVLEGLDGNVRGRHRI